MQGSNDLVDFVRARVFEILTEAGVLAGLFGRDPVQGHYRLRMLGPGSAENGGTSPTGHLGLSWDIPAAPSTYAQTWLGRNDGLTIVRVWDHPILRAVDMVAEAATSKAEIRARVDVPGGPSENSAVEASADRIILRSDVVNVEGSTGEAVRILTPAGARPFLSLYQTGPNTRIGRVGFTGTTGGEFQVVNEVAAGGMRLSAPGQMILVAGGAEAARITTARDFLVGKTAAGAVNTGFECRPNGIVTSTADTPTTQLWITKNGTADANGQVFITFRRTGSAQIGSVTQVGTTGVAYNTTSDYRIKDELGELGELEDVLASLDALRPIRWREKGSGDDGPAYDGFLAHELAEVVPDAVTGEKDAVDEDGAPILQSVDHSRLVPRLVAAAKALKLELEREHAARLELEARLEALEQRLTDATSPAPE